MALRAMLPLASLMLAPAAAEACATCIASAYGDRTFNWAFLSMLVVPFVIAAGIGAVLLVSYRRGARALHDQRPDTPHLLPKETT
jgi:hypothetical protein